MSRVLVFSDTHYPFSIKGYEDFLYEVYKKYHCDTVVHCGDLVDFHALSSHPTEPDAKDPETELDWAITCAKRLYKKFKKVHLVLGNHDQRVLRAGAAAKLTPRMLVPFRELLHIPRYWKIADEFIIDDVLYIHGEGYSGLNAHRTVAMTEGMSTVIGHLHSHAGIAYLANKNSLIWGMNVGCGIDRKTYGMRYGKNFKYKPTIGCGVVIDGKQPSYIPMDLGSKVIRVKR